LGSAVTSAFVKAGWRVVVPWIVEAELERLDPHPDVKALKADLFEPDSAREPVRLRRHPPGPMVWWSAQ